jgi:TorA maturation chaperone TorD
VFIREVDAQFLRQLKTPCFYKSLKSAGIDFGDKFIDQNERELLENLAVEYARLFIIPGCNVSLYESVYADKMFYSEQAQQVEEFYQRCGMEIVDETLIPDHIGLELELMSYLKQKEAKALENGRQDASRWIELQKEFMTTHLGKWATQFFKAVEKEAELPFYQEMAKLGKQLMKEEMDGYKLRQCQD